MLPRQEEMLRELHEALKKSVESWRDTRELAAAARTHLLRTFAAFVAFQHKFLSYQLLRYDEFIFHE